MMGDVSLETCWALYKYGIIKILIHCCILLDFLYELYYDARIHEHQGYLTFHISISKYYQHTVEAAPWNKRLHTRSYPIRLFIVEWDGVCGGVPSLMGPVSVPRILDEWIWNTNWLPTGKEKPKCSDETPFHCHFVHIKSRMICPEFEASPPRREAGG
jgi:hypothetical protein